MLELTLFNSSSREIRQYNAVIFSLSMIAPDSNRLDKSIIHQEIKGKKPRLRADDFKCSCLKKQYSCFMKVFGVCLPLSYLFFRKPKLIFNKPGHSSPPIAKLTILSRMTIYSTNTFFPVRKSKEIQKNRGRKGRHLLSPTAFTYLLNQY